jgi:hypothetical protein
MGEHLVRKPDLAVGRRFVSQPNGPLDARASSPTSASKYQSDGSGRH